MNILNKKLVQSIYKIKKLVQNTKPILLILLVLISIPFFYITFTNTQERERNEDVKNEKNDLTQKQQTKEKNNSNSPESPEHKHQTTQTQQEDDALNESNRESLFFSNKNLKNKKGNDYLILKGMIHHQNSDTIWVNNKKITIKEENKRFMHKIGKTKFYIEKVEADGVTICIINDDNSTREMFLKTHQKTYLN